MWSGKVPCNLGYTTVWRHSHGCSTLGLGRQLSPTAGIACQHAVMRAQRGYEDAFLRWKAFRRLIFARSIYGADDRTGSFPLGSCRTSASMAESYALDFRRRLVWRNASATLQSCRIARLEDVVLKIDAVSFRWRLRLTIYGLGLFAIAAFQFT